MRPELPCALFDAPPTGVHWLWELALLGSIAKMRKLAVAGSTPGSPRPVEGTGFWKLIDQLLSVPVRLAAESLISRVQTPSVRLSSRLPSGSCGLNLPTNGPPPFC